MANLINDNGVVGFTRTVALTLPLGGGSLTLVLYDFKIDTGVNAEFEVTNNLSATTGYMAQRGVNKGSATAAWKLVGTTTLTASQPSAISSSEAKRWQ